MRSIDGPPSTELEYRFPVYVSHWRKLEAWARAEASRISGNTGCRVDDEGWRGTTIWFDTFEKAQRFTDLVAEQCDIIESKSIPKRSRLDEAYRAAALSQHAVIWGLSTGIMLEVVRAYRRSRYECSAHGVANFAAALVIVERCPHLNHAGWDGIERARDLAEYMLIYYEARHRSWFWDSLEGAHYLPAFAYHK